MTTLTFTSKEQLIAEILGNFSYDTERAKEDTLGYFTIFAGIDYDNNNTAYVDAKGYFCRTDKEVSVCLCSFNRDYCGATCEDSAEPYALLESITESDLENAIAKYVGPLSAEQYQEIIWDGYYEEYDR